MNLQKMLIGVATTAVGFAFGLYVYNKMLVGKMRTMEATPSMPVNDTEAE